MSDYKFKLPLYPVHRAVYDAKGDLVAEALGDGPYDECARAEAICAIINQNNPIDAFLSFCEDMQQCSQNEKQIEFWHRLAGNVRKSKRMLP